MYDWSSWRTLVPLILGIFGIIGFIIYPVYTSTEPLIRRALFNTPTAIVAYIGMKGQGWKQGGKFLQNVVLNY